MTRINYFAYGSNMSEPRLISRVPSTTKMCIATLKEYQLRFNKKSIDGSGKANAHYSENPNDFIIGVVFTIDEQDKEKLNREEQGYTPKTVHIDGIGDVYLYVANQDKIDESLKPYDWYLFHLKFGVILNNIDYSYAQQIINHDTLRPDPKNQDRYVKGLDECISLYPDADIPPNLSSDFNNIKH
ncbi:MAG: gamma-glutamylcyclotransferase [Proteobacteria bacterium]|nr:MAG: gamma-glutamylcyclotransferase [Pseudomonadota bacterium]